MDANTGRNAVMTQHATRNTPPYRGRIAPSPTGYLHVGHARTFWTAQQRTRAQNGKLSLRNEDLDRDRCKPEFVQAMYDDLRWFGFEWSEGPDCSGPFAPYSQSERMEHYRATLNKLFELGVVYPCTCSRKTSKPPLLHRTLPMMKRSIPAPAVRRVTRGE